jgi:hypothetical protein
LECLPEAQKDIFQEVGVDHALLSCRGR